MRLEWNDPDGGGQSSRSPGVTAAIIVGVLGMALLGVIGYSVWQGGVFTPAPSGNSTSTSPTGVDTRLGGGGGTVYFASLPPAPGSGQSLSCGWAAPAQASIACDVESGNGSKVLVALELSNTGTSADRAALNYTAAPWVASCRLETGADPPYVESSSPFSVPPGTTPVYCELEPPAPGSAQFQATLVG